MLIAFLPADMPRDGEGKLTAEGGRGSRWRRSSLSSVERSAILLETLTRRVNKRGAFQLLLTLSIGVARLRNEVGDPFLFGISSNCRSYCSIVAHMSLYSKLNTAHL
jgi:hypothetical protein